MNLRRLPCVLMLLCVFLAMPSGPDVVTAGAANPIRPSHSSVPRFAGLAIGVPSEDLDTASHAGGLNIQYAAPGGLPTAGGRTRSSEA